MAYGQKYRDLPFDERFVYPRDERQDAIRELIMQFQNQQPEAPTEFDSGEGYEMIDPYGFRGTPRGGYGILKARGG